MNELNQESIYYKPESAPDTAYQRGVEEWDNIIGRVVVQKYNWMKIALGLLVVSIILTAGLVWQSLKSSVVPYVVQVDKGGVVQAVGLAKQTNFEPNKAVINYFLAQFVQRIRSLPLDAVLAKNQWKEAYIFLKQSAANQLNEIAQKDDPFKKIGQEMCSVEINNVVSISPDTYQLRWSEKRYSREGGVLGTATYTGIFTVEIVPPTTEELLKVNPLGLYIKSFSWSKDV